MQFLLLYLQDMQRQQAVLLVELQQLRQPERDTTAAAEAATTTAAAAPAGPTAAELELITKLESADQQRSELILQVQELEQSLQSAREAAAAAEAGRKQQQDAAAAVLAAVPSGGADAVKLAEVKAEMVQLRGQLAATRYVLWYCSSCKHHVLSTCFVRMCMTNSGYRGGGMLNVCCRCHRVLFTMALRLLYQAVWVPRLVHALLFMLQLVLFCHVVID
jgi:hypothetical protein